MRRRLLALFVVLGALSLFGTVARADGLGSDAIIAEKLGPPTLWDVRDAALGQKLLTRLEGLGLAKPIAERKIGVALVDLSDFWEPRTAEVNGDVMLYAASLPKIAILLAAFERYAAGELELNGTNLSLLLNMIRRSSNTAATALMQEVGKPFIADVLRSPRYKLYDPMHNGGLWAGKDYGAAGLWERDPLHNLSHGATAMQVARFYYLLETGRLVDPEASLRMKQILAHSAIKHKFIKALDEIDPTAHAYRKSGTWGIWHADSALIERAGHRYIAVGLCESPEGGKWLEKILPVLDDLVMEPAPTQLVTTPAPNPLQLQPISTTTTPLILGSATASTPASSSTH